MKIGEIFPELNKQGRLVFKTIVQKRDGTQLC